MFIDCNCYYLNYTGFDHESSDVEELYGLGNFLELYGVTVTEGTTNSSDSWSVGLVCLLLEKALWDEVDAAPRGLDYLKADTSTLLAMIFS